MAAGGQAQVVFVSYAHEDVDLLERLLVVLEPLVSEGHLDIWADRRVGVARQWDQEIEDHLRRAEVAVLLVSADFLASDYVKEVELQRLVERAVPRLCVPVGYCAWRKVWALASVQWPLPPERPLRAMRRAERDRALVAVYEALDEVAASLGSRSDDGTGGPTIGPRPATALLPAAAGPLLGVPPLPARYQPRPVDLARLKARVRQTASVGLVGRQAASGLHGQGGVGKSVLAAALCHDVEVRSWFPDGICWVSVGESVELVSIQRQLAHLFGAEIETSNPVDGLHELRQLLGGRRCLVVVDDVWSRAGAEAFEVTSEEGRVLYTTRDAAVLAAIGAAAQPVTALDPVQSLAFLERAAGAVVEDDRTVMDRVVAQSGGVILALSVLAALARAGRGWTDMAVELEALAGIFRTHPYADVFKAMRLAVGGLGSGDARRYRLLGVFPEDVPVPQATVGRLWAEPDPGPTLGRLADARLLDWSDGRVSFHDLQRAFVIFDAPGPWALAHRHLLDAHRPPEGWPYLPDDDPYLWDYLFHHLEMAGEHREISAVATSGRWLARRVHRDGPYAAELDLLVAEPYEPAVAPAVAVLRRWAPLFPKGLPQSGVAATLVSRLPSAEAAVADLLGPVWLQPAEALPEPSINLLRSLTGHTGVVRAVTFAHDGRTAASGGADGTVRLWDPATGAELHSLIGHTGAVDAVAFAPDGHTLASAGRDGTVRLWDSATGAGLHALPGPRPAHTVAFSPDGRTLASAGHDGIVRLWDPASGAVRHALTGHTSSVQAVAFSPDGRTLASAAGDGTVRMWDPATGAELPCRLRQPGFLHALAFSPDGGTLAVAGGPRNVVLWDPASGTERRALDVSCSAVAFASDGRTLALGGGRAVQLRDAASGARMRSLTGHAGSFQAVAFAPDGRTLASAGTDGAVRLWDATEAEVRAVGGRSASVHVVAFAPDSRTLASAGGAAVQLRDVATGTEVRALTGHRDNVGAVAFAPDGRTLAAGAGGTVRLWDVATGDEVRALAARRSASVLAFAPDGRILASAGTDRIVRLWDPATGDELRPLSGHTDFVYALAFAPDGHTLASAGHDGTVRLWDPARGTERHVLEGSEDRPLSALAFSPDGRFLAGGGTDRTVHLWDPHTGNELPSLRGHTGSVTALAFAPGGHLLASAGKDGTVRVWDAGTRAELTALVLPEPVDDIDWAPDGTTIAAASGTTLIRLRVALHPFRGHSPGSWPRRVTPER